VNQLLEGLIRRLPAESVIAAESSRTLDETILPELAKWDIRRYGGTQIAIRILAPGAGPVGEPPRARGEGEADADR
jgi:hypothetical protein